MLLLYCLYKVRNIPKPSFLEIWCSFRLVFGMEIKILV